MKKRNYTALVDKISFTEYLLVILGCAVYALSVALFTTPNNIAPGGIVGISTMIHYLYPALPVGITTLVFNIPIFVWGGLVLGWKYLTRSVLATFLSSVFIDFFSLEFMKGVIPPYTGDSMLVSVFGGLLCGVGLALIFYCGSSTGGTDIVSRIMHDKMPHISMGNFMMGVDFVVVVLSAFVFGNIDNALYAIIFIFVNTKIIDTVLYGMSRNNGKLLFIITSHYEDVTGEILRKIDRGVTLLDAQGGFRQDNKKVLLCALRPQQVHKTSSLVKKIDPEAFIIITTANAIKGRGFPAFDEEGGEKVYGDIHKDQGESLSGTDNS